MVITTWERIYIRGMRTRYVVNAYGQVANTETQKILAQTTDDGGYKIVSLSCNGKNYKCKVHRLVAQAFIPNPKNKPTVNHISGIKSDNFYKNLEWATYKEQMEHARRLGLLRTLRGADAATKYTEKQIRRASEMIIEGNMSDFAIGRELQMHKKYIYILRHKKAWTDVTDEYFTKEGSTTIETHAGKYYIHV